MGAAAVGGDWFEAIELPDGRVLLVVGDVVGHDMHAAAAIGQIRSALLTVAADGTTPEEVVERLDGLVKRFGLADVATCVVATLGPPDADGGRELVYRRGWPTRRPCSARPTAPSARSTSRSPRRSGSSRPGPSRPPGCDRVPGACSRCTPTASWSPAPGPARGRRGARAGPRPRPGDADDGAVRDHLLDQAGGRSDKDLTCLLVVRLPRADEAAASDGGAPPHA